MQWWIYPSYFPSDPLVRQGLSTTSWNICLISLMFCKHLHFTFYDWCFNLVVKDISSVYESDSDSNSHAYVISISDTLACFSFDSSSEASDSSHVAIITFFLSLKEIFLRPFFHKLGTVTSVMVWLVALKISDIFDITKLLLSKVWFELSI